MSFQVFVWIVLGIGAAMLVLWLGYHFWYVPRWKKTNYPKVFNESPNQWVYENTIEIDANANIEDYFTKMLSERDIDFLKKGWITFEANVLSHREVTRYKTHTSKQRVKTTQSMWDGGKTTYSEVPVTTQTAYSNVIWKVEFTVTKAVDRVH